MATAISHSEIDRLANNIVGRISKIIDGDDKHRFKQRLSRTAYFHEQTTADPRMLFEFCWETSRQEKPFSFLVHVPTIRSGDAFTEIERIIKDCWELAFETWSSEEFSGLRSLPTALDYASSETFEKAKKKAKEVAEKATKQVKRAKRFLLNSSVEGSADEHELRCFDELVVQFKVHLLLHARLEYGGCEPSIFNAVSCNFAGVSDMNQYCDSLNELLQKGTITAEQKEYLLQHCVSSGNWKLFLIGAAVVGAGVGIWLYRQKQKSKKQRAVSPPASVATRQHHSVGGYLAIAWGRTSRVDWDILRQNSGSPLAPDVADQIDRCSMFRYLNAVKFSEIKQHTHEFKEGDELQSGEYFIGFIHDRRGKLSDIDKKLTITHRETIHELALDTEHGPRFEFMVVNSQGVSEAPLYNRGE